MRDTSFTRDSDPTFPFPYNTMSSRHDYRRRDRSWERDDRDKGRDRDRDRDRDRYSRRRSSRSRSPRRSGMCYQSTLSYNRSTVLQIDVTMEETGMRTGETGIPGTHAAAMSEIGETHPGGMERRTGIGMRRTKGTERRVGMQSTRQRGLLSRVHGWIQSPGRQ